MANIEDIRLDITEFESLLLKAERPKVKGCLSVEISRLRTQVTHLLDNEKADKPEKIAKPSVKAPTRMLSTITNYGWDQSDKFMKIYVTINGVQGADKENVKCEFTDRSFKLYVSDLSGKDHTCHISHLHDNILPADSYHKVKTDMVLLMLKKEKAAATWPYVIQKEEKAAKPGQEEEDENKAEAKPPGPGGEGEDPNAGLMGLMQKMYDEGDDEMKRTIQKTWYESRNKQEGGAPGGDAGGMGGMLREPGMGGAGGGMGGAGGGMGGMADLMAGMGGMGGGGGGAGGAGGAGGMPDMASMMAAMGGAGGPGGAGGAGGMPDMAAMMAAMGGAGGKGGMGGMGAL